MAGYGKLKVVELKEVLKERGLPVSGKKDELISRLEENDKANEPTAAPEETAPAVESVQPEEHAAEKETDERSPKRRKLSPVNAPAPAVTTTKPAVAAPPAAQTQLDSAVPKPANGHPATVREADVAAPANDSFPEPAVPDEGEEDDLDEQAFDQQLDVQQEVVPNDMYLDTVNRAALDFDFERLCSVTLSHNNIYACLTDGKYFQGRGKSSPAYAHAIGCDHHVFINLDTLKVYVLPDGYEVNDPSLDDIKYLLYPKFTREQLDDIDAKPQKSFTLSQTSYFPGFVGLNDIKANSYMNAVLHSLLHVVPLRNYFILDPACSDANATELVKRFSTLARKVWTPKAFKSQVSPHEVLQECVRRSEGRFKITEHGDPVEFLGWLLNTLHRDLGGNKKPLSSIVNAAFQGELRIEEQKVLTTGEFMGKPKFDLARDIKTTSTPFLFLAIDLPPMPLFTDQNKENIIPQVPLSTVLAKYDGATTQETAGLIRRYKLTRLPPFLILHIKRFTKNNFVEQKNSTIITFPLKDLDLKDCLDGATVSQYYNLVSNVTTSSTATSARSEPSWRVHAHLRARPIDADAKNDEDELWFQIQDLIVDEVNKSLVPLGESYIQIWERKGEGEKTLRVERPKPKSASSVQAANGAQQKK